MTEQPERVPTGTVSCLFTDIAGSTRLMARLGDDYAPLLELHHRLLRAAFEAHGGQEIDSQGDAFFFAFRRARDAVAAAVDAQRALGAERWPEGVEISVRMGIHTGEPGLAAGGYHGLDVVRAARIAAAGHGGQILVSSATRDIVGDEALRGVSFRDLGEHRLKDLERIQRVFQVVAPGLPEDFPPPRTGERREPLLVGGREEELAAAAQAAVEGPVRRVRRPLLLAGLAAVVLALIAALAAFLLTREDERPPVVLPNSLVKIDPETNEVVQVVPVGRDPVAVAVIGDSVWVANEADDTVTRIDPDTGDARPIGGIKSPTSIAPADGGQELWVGNSATSELVRLDAESGAVLDRIALRGGNPAFVAVGLGSVWVSQRIPFDPAPAVTRLSLTGTVQRTFDLEDGASPTEVAVGEGAAWVALRGHGSLLRIDAQDGEMTRIPIGGPSEPTLAFDDVWVASGSDDVVRRVDPVTREIDAIVQVGDEPWGVAAGKGSVWVSSHREGTVSRIDPGLNQVVETIRIGQFPTSTEFGLGAVWVVVSGRCIDRGSECF